MIFKCPQSGEERNTEYLEKCEDCKTCCEALWRIQEEFCCKYNIPVANCENQDQSETIKL